MLRSVLAAVLLVFAFTGPARAQKLTKLDIAKRGKEATALVEVKSTRMAGTAFCVHADGMFVTNEHIIRGAETAEISVVLNPSLKTQRVLTARVVRSDKNLDLALLRVEKAEALAVLPLGSAADLTELMDVFAFGFPFGRALAPDRKEYPAVSVNAGNVNALRRKGTELDRIQLDVALNPGNSGGPVLDETGKVVGVVVSGVTAARINLAIPVSHVDKFLKTPDVAFKLPELTPETLRTPVEFTARVTSFVPNAPEPIVRLILKSGNEPAREFPMKRRGADHVVTATPIVKAPAGQVTIAANFESGSISGATEDVAFKVGARPVKLSDVRRIEFKPKPHVVLLDDKIVEGAITGLGTIEVRLGDPKVAVNLLKAVQIQIRHVAEQAITATVIVSASGAELARVERPIIVRGREPAAGEWTNLGGKNPFPALLEANEYVVADKDGLRMNGRHYLKTKKGTYLSRDFKFELVYSLAAGSANDIIIVGVGEALPAGPYNEASNSVAMGIHPPNLEAGRISLGNKTGGGAMTIGRISKAGTHRIIIEKKGDAVTFAIDVDNDGKSDDDIEKTIPDIKAFGPFLHGKNTHIFVGGGGTYRQVRISE